MIDNIARIFIKGFVSLPVNSSCYGKVNRPGSKIGRDCQITHAVFAFWDEDHRRASTQSSRH